MISIFQFENAYDMLKKNEQSIYISNTIGLQNYDNLTEYDNIVNQIDNFLFKKHIFNINELFIIRNPNIEELLIYNVFYNKLYLVKSKNILINAFIVYDRYVIIKEMPHEKQEVDGYLINTYKYFIFDNNTLDLISFEKEMTITDVNDYINDMIKKIEYSNDKKNLEIIKSIEYPETISLKYPLVFSLQEELCMTFEEDEKFLIKVILDKKEYIFNSIYDLVVYMNKTFYDPIKKGTYVV